MLCHNPPIQESQSHSRILNALYRAKLAEFESDGTYKIDWIEISKIVKTPQRLYTIRGVGEASIAKIQEWLLQVMPGANRLPVKRGYKGKPRYFSNHTGSRIKRGLHDR